MLAGYSKKGRKARRTRRASKRSGFGEVRHAGKKIAARYWKSYHAGKSEPTRAVAATVYIERATVPTNTGRKAGYWGRVCVGKRSRYKTCGPHEFGKTPTKAMKAAMKGFARR